MCVCVGGESAVDLTLTHNELSLNNKKLNFFKKSNKKTGNFKNITRWTDGICV